MIEGCNVPKITTPKISKLIFNKKRLFIPRSIEIALEKRVKNTADVVYEASEYLMEKFKPMHTPIDIDYNDSAVVDGYSLCYTRRNVLIPRLAFRDITLNSKFQRLSPSIKVLDLGCGTGAIVLGILEMFKHPPLDTVSIEIDAVDIAPKMLKRLKELVKEAKLPFNNIALINQDVTDIAGLEKILSQRGKYDYIFAANLFVELENDDANNLLKCIAQQLTNSGMIFIVNAPKDYFKTMMPELVETSHQMNLTVYYPCPPVRQGECEKCWFWRENEFDNQGNLTVEGRIVSGRSREQLVASWLVLSKRPNTIYDDFIAQHPKLSWGPISFYGQDSGNSDSQVCTARGIINRLRVGQSIKRGSLVGGHGRSFGIDQIYEL